MRIKTQLVALAIQKPDDIVRVAGILNRIKNWFAALTDTDVLFAQQNLKEETVELNQMLPSFYKKIGELLQSIKDMDYIRYRDLLPIVQEEALKLNIKVKDVSHAAEKIQIDYQRYVTKEQHDDPAKFKSLKENTENYYKEHKTDHDVPFGIVDEPLSSKKWFARFNKPGGIIFKPGAKANLINKMGAIIPNSKERYLAKKKIEATIDQILPAAILNGKIIDYKLAPNSKDKKSPGRFNNRKFGEAVALIKVNNIKFPGVDWSFSATLTLLDEAAALGGADRLSLWESREVEGIRTGATTPISYTKDLENSSPTELDEIDYGSALHDEGIDSEDANDADIFTSSSSLLNKIIKEAVDPSAYKSFTDDFWQKFIQVAHDISADPIDLAKVLYSESGLDPAAVNIKNGHPVAKGLCQLLLKTAKGLGMTSSEWDSMESMPAVQQLDWVEKYFKMAGSLKQDKGSWGPTELYVALAAPGYLSKASDPNAVLYAETLPNGKPNQNYLQNKGLDRDKKGFISPNDLTVSISRPLPKDLVDKINSFSNESDTSSNVIQFKKKELDVPSNLIRTLFMAASVSDTIKNDQNTIYSININKSGYKHQTMLKMAAALISGLPETKAIHQNNKLFISAPQTFQHFSALKEIMNLFKSTLNKLYSVRIFLS